MKRPARLIGLIAALLLPASLAASDNLISNGGFEDGSKGWAPIWTRDAGAGTAVIDSEIKHDGANSLHVTLQGNKDFALRAPSRVAVEPGDIFELETWVKLNQTSETGLMLSVTTYDAQNQVQSWLYAHTQLNQAGPWKKMTSRFIVPPGIAHIVPRLTGNGPLDFHTDDFSLIKKGNAKALRDPQLPTSLTLSNSALAVTLDTATTTITVIDRRNQHRAATHELTAGLSLLTAKVDGNSITFTLLHSASTLTLAGTIQLDPEKPEFTLTLASNGDLQQPLAFPGSIRSEPGDHLILALNEGISYPVEDTAVEPRRFLTYCGHSYSMPFWGSTSGERGYMTIVETPDDAAIQMSRIDGKLTLTPEWQPQCQRFGYPRRLRYIFFDQGGYVAMAKRYRSYAQQTGLFKTLEQKRRDNPNVDRLIGAVNVWFMDGNHTAMAKEMHALGIKRMLWNGALPPQELAALNGLGLLTGRYDNYQDIVNPTDAATYKHPPQPWHAEAWPKDLNFKANGDWRRAWRIDKPTGSFYCGMLCDKRAPEYAVRAITDDLSKRDYTARFIDTTTATPWNECYNSDHPMTRSDSRHWKMELLRTVSEQFKLVTGSETGHDAAVPYVHYFEGMLSLGQYRVPDAGRKMADIWDEVPATVRQFQLGHDYRIPLWELVYHDCVVSHWYWGDYNNKLPALWDKRDLFNILYGTAPMFLFKRNFWEKNKDRFVQTYRNVCPVARSVGYSEMTDHRFLTPDRAVQQTTFANGTVITVNFGDTPYSLPNGAVVAPSGFNVQHGK